MPAKNPRFVSLLSCPCALVRCLVALTSTPKGGRMLETLRFLSVPLVVLAMVLITIIAIWGKSR